jgi:hypothetical protein
MASAVDLVEGALRRKVPFGVAVVDSLYLAEEVVRVLARRRKDGVSLLKKNHLLETARFPLRAVNGWALKLPGPHLAVEEVVPLLPANAYRPVTGREQSCWGFTLAVRSPGVGKVRIVVSFAHEALSGRLMGLVTNRVDGSAATISGLGSQRWPTATCYQDRKGQVGVSESRRRSTEALGKH